MGYPFVPNGRPDQLRSAVADIVGFGRSGIVVSHKAQTSHTDTTHPAKYNSCGRCFNLNFFYDEKLGMNSSHVMLGRNLNTGRLVASRTCGYINRPWIYSAKRGESRERARA